MNNKKITFSAIIGLFAIVVVAMSPSVMAQEDAEEKPDKIRPEITGSLPISETVAENLASVNVGILDAMTIAQEQVDGKVVRAGLAPMQGYLVYKIAIATDDSVYRIIVDAGNGEVLYISEGKTFEEIDSMFADRKIRHGDFDNDKKKEKFGKHVSELAKKNGKFGEYERFGKHISELAKQNGQDWNPERFQKMLERFGDIDTSETEPTLSESNPIVVRGLHSA